MKLADRVFADSAIAVALGTPALAFVRGYGTQLFQVIVFGAWSVVARLTSGQFADLHEITVLCVALLLNVLAFSLIGAPLWLLSRNRAPKLGSAAILGWLLLYLALLFFLFPATDGP